ncbi:MAG TPA: cytochrome c family protein [Micropepsaceae bacterium]|nr:cytochrome c family protein [Micropepsaceae bacterium]
MVRGRCFLGAAAFIVTANPASAADAGRGEKLFVECASCHSIERGGEGVGPSLFGLYQRKAGEVADYRYSPALKRSGITWSPQTLDTYLADPQKSVPGNRMPYSGMTNAQDRADLIAYFEKFAK